MLIPGFIISLLTFPGVIVHEMAHLCWCRLFGIRVHRVCYFRLGNPAGYVLHDSPAHAWQHLVIGLGPFVVNTLGGFFLGAAMVRHHRQELWLVVLWYWLAVSIAMHAFPSIGDARSIWSAAWSRKSPLPVKLLSLPLVPFIYLLALGSIFWLDVVYGVVVAILLPGLVFALR